MQGDAVNLIFSKVRLAIQPVDLIFNEPDEAIEGSVVVDFTATLPALDVDIHVGRVYQATIEVALPALTVDIVNNYDVSVSRPTIGSVTSLFQDAEINRQVTENHWQDAIVLGVEKRAAFEDAAPLRSLISANWTDADRTRLSATATFEDALSLQSTVAKTHWQDASRDARAATSVIDQNAMKLTDTFATGFYDALHIYRNKAAVHFQDARGQWRSFVEVFDTALGLKRIAKSRYQDAIKIGIGLSDVTTVSPIPCYIPPLGNLVHLVFDAIRDTSGNLVFFCDPQPVVDPNTPVLPDAQVVIPKQEVYVVINTTLLRRIEGNISLPVLSASMSLDEASWSWGVNITLPASEFANLQPVNGEAATLELTVNGVPYKLVVDEISRERSFGNAQISVTCRGLNAVLAAPHANVKTFTNPTPRTAQQIANDILTENNVSIGWTVDWGLTDWPVPAGAFVHTGTYMSALTELAAAAGGYIVPHPSLQSLSILPKYPSLPRDWSALTPDYEIPASVVTTESAQWFDRPKYNRVFVSGVSVGAIVQATLDGTAGDLAYPMITDPLITHVDAGRQRAVSVFGEGGFGANVTIRMPVLPATGIIPPGKFIRYTDVGQTWFGITRAVQLDIAQNGASTMQAINLEVRL